MYVNISREMNKKLRRPGIEPGAFEWESKILPLNHRRYYKT